MMPIARSPWTCRFGVSTLQDYHWKENREIVHKERLGKVYGQLTFVRAWSGPTKCPRFSVVSLAGEGEWQWCDLQKLS